MTRQPIIVADAGPLIRLAAAGLLDALRGTNRRIVLIDRIEDEIAGDQTKPFAPELKSWIAGMGAAIERVDTVVGYGIRALRERQRSAPEDRLLKSALQIGRAHV